jgi:hypothetical protein
MSNEGVKGRGSDSKLRVVGDHFSGRHKQAQRARLRVKSAHPPPETLAQGAGCA